MTDQSIHLLLIEDNPGDAGLIRLMLSEAPALSFDIVWVDNLTAGIERLQTDRVDIVLLDLGLPESSGLATLHHLLARAPNVPTLVVLSGLLDESIALQAVQTGAQDYLVKGHVDSALLVRSIRYALERSQAEDALRQARAELERRVAERTAELASAVEALHAEIGERERAEKALEERDAHVRRLVESNIIGIFFWDIAGGISDANGAFLQMIGYSREELVATGLKWKNLTPPEYFADDEHAADELRATGTCTPYEKEFLRKDGSRVPILVGGALVEDSASNGVAFVLDLTSRRQAEEERQARRIAEEASRAKSDFLANMSHELRSPLNTMIGFARLMARQPGLPHELQEDMRIVLRSGEHLHALINQVLDLSKIEAGSMLLNEINFDLDRLLDELEDMFALRARDKGLELIVRHDREASPYIHADLVKLRQILINLLNNALKFTEEGRVILHVDHRQEPDGSRRLQCTVSDTGTGIRAEEQHRLFNAFVQAEAGRKALEGTGLGLKISRSFVRLMGGELVLDSTPGKGTSLSFEIPIRAAAVDTVAMAAETASQRVVALAPGQPKYRILAVDDRHEARQLLMRLLTPLGFELREACDGREALEVWRSWRPHLIWMDMRMPVMTGRESTRRIRAEPGGDEPVIIALTASSFDEERNAILAAGCTDFLSKPFEEASLFSLMQKHLGLRYVYQVQDTGSTDRQADIQPGMAACLPPEIRKELQDGLVRLDPLAIANAIRRLGEIDKDMAEAIQGLADNYQYERLLQLLQRAQPTIDEKEAT